MNDGENFIKLYNQKIWYKLPTTRVEKENFPERAIHEAMVNALVHRDYGVIGSEIHIDIFDDRIVIQNPGGMYDGVPVQNQELENVVSTRRNPVIADLLTRMDFMERRGSGFRKILDAVKFAPNYTEENLPVFNSNPYSFSVTFKNMNYGVEPISEDNSQKTREKTREKTRDKIIKAIAQNATVTTAELADIVGISDKGVEWQIKQLKAKGIIRRVAGANGGHWEIVAGEDNSN